MCDSNGDLSLGLDMVGVSGCVYVAYQLDGWIRLGSGDGGLDSGQTDSRTVGLRFVCLLYCSARSQISMAC